MTKPISILPGYNPAIAAKRKARALSENQRTNARKLMTLMLERETQQRQRLQDMCEDAGLVFSLPSLNHYSGE